MNSYLIKNNNNILGIYNDLDLALNYIYSLLNSNLIQKKSKIIIYEYKINSCIILQEYNVDLNYIITNRSIINYSKSDVFIKNENKYESDSILNTSVNKTTSSINYSSSVSDSSTINNSSTVNNSSVSDSSINTSEEDRQRKNKREYLENQNKLAQEKIDVIHQINLLKEEKKKNDEKLNQYNYDIELYNKFKESKNENASFVIPIMFEEKYNMFSILDNKNNLTFENFIKTFKPSKMNTTYDELFDEDKSSDNISEIFSNANDEELLNATNQS
jgi:hypothetical protein